MKIVLVCFDDVNSISTRLLHKIIEKKGFEVHSLFLLRAGKVNDFKLVMQTLKKLNPLH